MKLVVAIVQDHDAGAVIDALVAAEFRSTRINTSGGFLKRGNATYRVGTGDEIRVGPGACAHTMWQMHNSPKAPDQFRMLITFLTPVDHVLQIRTGRCHTA